MKDTVRQLQRKLQQNPSGFPSDLLQPSKIETKFEGHIGFPEQADSLAYEPVQRLLAVGTQDGRVKLIGKPGVEVSLRSSSRSPTKYLGFLRNKGGILRVTQDGDIQLFSVVEKKLVTSTWLQGDSIKAVVLLPNDPYIMLGCGSGNIRVVALLDQADDPADGVKQAVDLSLQPYQVLAEDLDAKGPVVSMDVTLLKGRPLLLIVHKLSGAVVWDVRAEKIVCAALDDENEVSKPTSCCWVGERANCFAVGYDDGSILLYGVPRDAQQDDPFKVSAPWDAQLLMTFRVAARGTRAAPVKSLTFVAGDRGEDWLLVLGGQALEEPDMLTKMPLAARAANKTIPWFGTIKGHVLAPYKGCLTVNDNPSAIMVLTEGGQLVVHDLVSWQPMPLTLPFQELPPISVTKLVPTVSLALLGMAADASDVGLPSPGSAHSGWSGRTPDRTSSPAQHALTLDKLCRASRQAKRVGAASGSDAWPIHGGEPAVSWAGGEGESALLAGRHPSALYFTGHRDGRVRVWDATTQVPTLLLALPASMQERLRPVTALEVCPFSGIVIVGHQGGEVRLYQFTDSEQTVHRMNVDESRVPYDNVATQPAGFQYVMRYSIHSATISSVCLATKLKLAVVADDSGAVSVVDLMQPAPLWSTKPLQRAVRHLAVGCHAVPASRSEKGPPEQPTGETERLIVFAACADSTLLMLSLEKGEVLEKPMKPKNASRPLAMALLDVNGMVLAQPQGHMIFPWANNNAASPILVTEVAPEPESSMRNLNLEVRLPNLSPRPLSAQRQSSLGVESARSMPYRAASIEPPEDSTGDSLELRELPSDDDVDEHLAAAAAGVPSDPRQKKPIFKLPKGFLRPGAMRRASSAEVSDLPCPPSPGATSPMLHSATPSEATSPQQPLAVELPSPGEIGAFELAQPGPISSPVPVPSRPTSPDTLGSPALNLSPRLSTPAPRKKTQTFGVVDYPYITDAEPAPAAYVLLCTENYLRIYRTENVRVGDRSTEKKAYEESPLVFAGVFMSIHGPGVVTISTDGALAVRTVPGLDCIYRLRLDHSNVLGFHWSWGADPSQAASKCACSLDGQVVLVGPGNEIARLMVVQGCIEPAAPVSTYDAALAEAANAALRAVAVAAARKNITSEYVVRESPPQPVTLDEPALAAEQQHKGLGKFFNTVKGTATGVFGTATGVFDTAGKAAQNALQVTVNELDRGFKTLSGTGSEGASQHRKELPCLPALFATPVEPLRVDDIDYMSDEEPSPASPEPPKQHSRESSSATKPSAGALSKAAIGGLLRRASGKEKEAKEKKKERGELMQNAATRPTYSSPPTHMRSASSVREAYGRPRHTERSQQAKNIMEQNRRMLHERGEKLQDLELRSAQLQDDASDFASLAKQLEDAYATRKWWQM